MIQENKKIFDKPLLAVIVATLALVAFPAAAQQGGSQKDIRSLPASAEAPPDVAEQMKRDKEKIPEPPAKGKGKGKALPASATPPPDVAEQIKRDKEKIPNPPGKARQADLIEKIKKQPGGAERVDKANRGHKPENPGKAKSTAATDHILRGIASVFISEANAGQTFTLDLTPQTNSNGSHASLYSSNPYGSATFFCAIVNYYDPNNSRIRLYRSTNSAMGHSCTNPYAYMSVGIPAAGYYIINANAYSYGNTVEIKHYESGSYPTLDTLPRISRWADYPTLQYLQPGTHTFYFLFPNGGFVSRLSVDSYP